MASANKSVANDVLAANGAFYRAFSSRNVPAMDALWARAVSVACIHPGWDALRGRELVMGSWRSIMESATCPEVVCEKATAHVLGDSAFVVCEERVDGGADLLVATNIFVREAGGWKLAHHQAAPVAAEMFGEPASSEHQTEDSGPLGLN